MRCLIQALGLDPPRLLGAVLALLVAVSLALPATAGAAPIQQSLFMDDDLLLYRGPERTEATMRELRWLGVDMVRASMHWRAVAPGHRRQTRPPSLRDPSDPRSYPPESWDTYDTLARTAKRHGIQVFFNITGGAPLWATGIRRGRRVSLQYLPDPAAFGDFMAAVGRRFSGTYRDENQGGRPIPQVRVWSIWNEPNHGAQLQPQWRKPLEAAGEPVPYSPHWYRKLVRAAQTALFATGHSADVILLGETAPRGNDQPGVKRHIRPLKFLREFFCLDDRLRPFPKREAERHACDYDERGPVFVTGYAHHPYSIASPPSTPGAHPDDALLGDTAKLLRLLDRAGELSRIPVNLPLWYTEYGYQTRPPDPIRGVGLQQQADWLADAELYTWSNPRVLAHTQFLMIDTLPRVSYPVGSRKYWGTYQSGLRWANGVAKPAYRSYRLPFVAGPPEARLGELCRFWGMARPGLNGAGQTVRLEFAPQGAAEYVPVGSPIAVGDGRGYFAATHVAALSGYWRFAWLDPSSGQWVASLPRYIEVG